MSPSRVARPNRPSPPPPATAGGGALSIDQHAAEVAPSDPDWPGLRTRLRSTLAGLRPKIVLCHIDLIQDLDILLPVLLAARDDKRLRFKVTVARWLTTASPRVAKALALHGIAFRYVSRNEVTAGRRPSLRDVAAVLTASESDQPTHTAGHALARRANALGIATFTLQHGLDSLGGDVRFASTHILGWHRPGYAPGGISEETLKKVLSVGRPMLEPPHPGPCHDVGVFENLHAEAYSEAERTAFIETLEAVLPLRPEVTFYVRPHPAGRWFDSSRDRFVRHRNAIFEPEALAKATVTPGYHEVAKCRRVITTPSTIALDAAMTGRPAALAMRGTGLYAGLPLLTDLRSWLDFIDGTGDAGDGLHLLEGILTEGYPAERVLQHLVLASVSLPARRPHSRLEK